MKISNLGEFGLIEKLSKKFNQTLPIGVVGIGDDCAVIPVSQELSWLVTTDALIEDIHFLRGQIKPQDLGHKALAVNLSDIAAMGGKPHSVFLTLSLPKETEIRWIDQFFEGFHSLAVKYNTLLLGGDTTGSKEKIAISVTAIGSAHPQKIKLRSTAQTGDIICVTNFLGDSGAGLASILGNLKITKDSDYLINRHYRPEPSLVQGAFLAGHPAVNAMMDVSDGVHSDLQRIMKASGCGANINMNQLPISDQLRSFCEQNNKDPLVMAAIGGEDYCLLVTVSGKDYETLSNSYYKAMAQKLYPIGEITSDVEKLIFKKNEEFFLFKETGFKHFCTL